MNWREFVASVIDSLAWPAAISIIVLVLREAIRRRIRELRRVRHGDTELEFGDAVNEAEKAAEQAKLPAPESTEWKTALVTELAAEISTAPRAAVIEAWQAVERELEALAEESGLVIAQHASKTQLAKELELRGVIDSALASVIVDLRGARNVAAHADAYTIDRDEVVDFVKLAGRVRSALRLTRQAQSAAMKGETTYDLLVYHDMTDPTVSSGGMIPRIGDNAEQWFGELGRERHVVAVGPGVHDNRVTVVLAHGRRPMPEIQALLDRQTDDGE